jgi:lysophospholipase
MLGFLPDFLPHRLQLVAANLMCRLGDPRRPAWKWSEKPGELPNGRAKLLTHDKDRYADESWWRAERPELVMGPGSWGWTRAALRSILFLQRPGLLEAVDTPVLLLAAQHDRLVSYRAIRRAAERIPNAELVSFGPEAYHELLRECDAVRECALAAIDAFLDIVAPA